MMRLFPFGRMNDDVDDGHRHVEQRATDQFRGASLSRVPTVIRPVQAAHRGRLHMRKVAGVLLAAAMLLPVGLVAAPAGAATLLTCTTLTGTAKWTPPVSPTVKATHNVVATGKISGCTGTKGITSGTFTFTSKGTTKENCAVLISSKAASTASSS